jgi:hypothetical protein
MEPRTIDGITGRTVSVAVTRVASWLRKTCLLCTSCWLNARQNMQTVCAYKIPMNFYRTTRRHIPEYSTLHGHLCEYLKFNTIRNNLLSNGAVNTIIILNKTNRYYRINISLFVQYLMRHASTFLFRSSSWNTQINNISPWAVSNYYCCVDCRIWKYIIVVLTAPFESTFKTHHGMHILKVRNNSATKWLIYTTQNVITDHCTKRSYSYFHRKLGRLNTTSGGNK